MNTKLSQLVAAIQAFCLVTISISAFAGRPENVTEAEMALLPRYCPDTQGFKYGDASYNTSPNAPRWVSSIGPGFWHVHHYCWGLIKFRRGERATATSSEKQGYRESALDDFKYVIVHAGTEFVLAPEILTWIGRTEILLRRPVAAEQAFAQARSLKPDYWPAYSHWAEYLMSSGRRADAMTVVKMGLQKTPEARVLREIYVTLGGKSGDIPPLPPKKEGVPERSGTAVTSPPPEHPEASKN